MAAADPERWVEEHGDCLYRFALLRVREPAVAEDLVQETFLAAIKGRDRFAGQSSERSWLVGILKHKIIDHIRKSVRERPVEFIDELPKQLEEQFEEHGYWRHDGGCGPKEWNTDDPTVLFQQKEFWQQMDDCLSRLPRRTADAFILREIDGSTGEEVCQVLGITPTNFWVLLHRARMQLRQCLETNWFEKGKT
jgi:RNA polymerase sigma-70 factor (ECF subfamily)